MEENQNSETRTLQEQVSPETTSPSGVSFPSVGQAPKSGGPKTILVIGILILVAVLGFVIFKSATKKEEAAGEPTPFENLAGPSESQVSGAAATPTASPVAIDKSKVKIQVQNGTGITGEAAYLQTQLKNLGYTNVKVGNASIQAATATTVTFSTSLDSAIVSEITAKLKALYQSVTTSTSGSQTFDVVVVTGLRKGATPKPSATPAASASPSASPTR